MKFWKMNGCGNEFAIFDGRASGGPLAFSVSQIKAISASTKCDQVLCIEPPKALGSDVFMRIWNSEGSEVGACGNGTRCVAWLVMEETGAQEVLIDTNAGALAATRPGLRQICVDMGKPLLQWQQIPLRERMDTRGVDLQIGPVDAPILALPGVVNMGNPHAVFFVDDVETVAVQRLGSMLEFHILFPEQANIGFAQILDRNHIRLKVWERGAGLTKACGSGACAAVVAAHRRGLTDRKTTVIVDGGELQINWRDTDDHVLMTGPIEMEFEGDVAL
ncbi:Diaminopimelate epimerase [hydrothermal vent metagenome]|uniref:Diaminopimelate epimerase n=1 Tax=hydrothermal vent metagenome TaxID=652676 RepID=A0A3B0S403_9ZZZZ